jgi:hypothetical protein
VASAHGPAARAADPSVHPDPPSLGVPDVEPVELVVLDGAAPAVQSKHGYDFDPGGVPSL